MKHIEVIVICWYVVFELQKFEIPVVIISIAYRTPKTTHMSESIQSTASKNPASNGGTKKVFRYLTLILTGSFLIIFLLSASLLSVFGISIWSWVNVLRFILGGLIILVVVAFFVIFKNIFKSKAVKK
jgi:hypothetical protein